MPHLFSKLISCYQKYICLVSGVESKCFISIACLFDVSTTYHVLNALHVFVDTVPTLLNVIYFN